MDILWYTPFLHEPVYQEDLPMGISGRCSYVRSLIYSVWLFLARVGKPRGSALGDPDALPHSVMAEAWRGENLVVLNTYIHTDLTWNSSQLQWQYQILLISNANQIKLTENAVTFL